MIAAVTMAFQNAATNGEGLTQFLPEPTPIAVSSTDWLGVAVIGLCRGLAISLHKFNFTRPPRLVEPRFERPVEAQECIPAFAGNRLHPVDFLAGGSLRAEPDIRGL